MMWFSTCFPYSLLGPLYVKYIYAKLFSTSIGQGKHHIHLEYHTVSEWSMVGLGWELYPVSDVGYCYLRGYFNIANISHNNMDHINETA